MHHLFALFILSPLLYTIMTFPVARQWNLLPDINIDVQDGKSEASYHLEKVTCLIKEQIFIVRN